MLLVCGTTQANHCYNSGIEWQYQMTSADFAWYHAGYYHNADTQMYFDNKTGGYYSGTDSKWYLYDGTTQQFQEWQQLSSY